MGTKYRKTHNGEPVEVSPDGHILVGGGTGLFIPTYMLEAEGYIEPVPTVTVELDRDMAESFVALFFNPYGDYSSCVEHAVQAIKAALND